MRVKILFPVSHIPDSCPDSGIRHGPVIGTGSREKETSVPRQQAQIVEDIHKLTAQGDRMLNAHFHFISGNSPCRFIDIYFLPFGRSYLTRAGSREKGK